MTLSKQFGLPVKLENKIAMRIYILLIYGNMTENCHKYTNNTQNLQNMRFGA